MFRSRSAAFSVRWRRLRREQLVRIDIANETDIRDLDQLDALAEILAQRSGQQIVYSSARRRCADKRGDCAPVAYYAIFVLLWIHGSSLVSQCIQFHPQDAKVVYEGLVWNKGCRSKERNHGRMSFAQGCGDMDGHGFWRLWIVLSVRQEQERG